jgi:LuxR family transcriptional regulator, activator of conjugal transfer of Ti plasmids
MDRTVADLLTDLKREGSVSDLQGRLLAGLGGLGLDLFSYVGLRLPRADSALPVILTTYPDHWVARYLTRDYQWRDPVMAQAQTAILPFRWSSLAPTPRQRVVMEEARAAGLVSGLCVPVHGAAGETAVLCFASSQDTPVFDALMARHEADLHVMGLYFHAAVAEALAKRPPDAPVRLTMREREILQWVAQGKTTWDISAIVAISERTVIFHIENLKRKLGVTSRSHAVAKAIRLGLISI